MDWGNFHFILEKVKIDDIIIYSTYVVNKHNKGDSGMDRIKELVAICNSAERYRIACMLNNAADYVRAVTIMEVVAARIDDLDPEDFRDERASTDRARTNAHNDFIASVDVVNKICDTHNVPRLYTGGSERREYGDFAMELVADVYKNRQ